MLHNLRRAGALLLFGLLLGGLPLCAEGFQPVRARHAMVASSHPEASGAGAAIMREGGNAVDAAVAVGFALAVVHPSAGNLGGGGFMLYRTAKGEMHFLDFREKAPAAASRNMYLDQQGNVSEESRFGYRAAAVPGTVAGFVDAERRWGKLGLAKVMEPAIRLARDGVMVTQYEAALLRDAELAHDPESSRIFQRNGRFYEQGEILKQPELARTLERIARSPDEFYRGPLASQIASTITQGGGLVSVSDLADYKVVERVPVHGSYRGYEIYSAPPPSSGGIALIETLNILEGFDLHAARRNSALHLHLVAEAYRRAFFDRSVFLGDPDFVEIPVAQLIDKKYAAEWRSSINPDKASVSSELQRPSMAQLDQSAALRAPYTGPENHDTTHYSIVDGAGGAVAVTTTLNDSFGSRATLPDIGFLLNNEMDDFTSKAGVPNSYGLIQGEANAIAPGKRPLSTMTPTMVVKDGRLLLVLGSPGGPTIITTVANVLINAVDFGEDIQRAVNAPRFHHQWMPDELSVEAWQLSPDTLELLEKMGHKIKRAGSWGDAECVAIDKNGERLGASDARNGGSAVGW
ncbi:MAG: gamma-glutamyltransferase [Candidatus Korobacteraceae bacterium]|jgi:gamma-glutamyltranspeptidase/glutathione hydrolase